MFIYLLIAVLAYYMHVPSAFYLFLATVLAFDMIVRHESAKRKKRNENDETAGK